MNSGRHEQDHLIGASLWSLRRPCLDCLEEQTWSTLLFKHVVFAKPNAAFAEQDLADVAGRNREDLCRRGRKARSPLRAQRLHGGDDVYQFPQQLDLSAFYDKAPGKQVVDASSSAGGLRMRHVFGEDLVRRRNQDLRVFGLKTKSA